MGRKNKNAAEECSAGSVSFAELGKF